MMTPRWWTLVVPACFFVAVGCGDENTPDSNGGGKGGAASAGRDGKGGKGGHTDAGASGEGGSSDGAGAVGQGGSTGGKHTGSGAKGGLGGGSGVGGAAGTTGGTPASGGDGALGGVGPAGGTSPSAGTGPGGGTSPTGGTNASAGTNASGGAGGEPDGEGGEGGGSTSHGPGCSAAGAGGGTPELCSIEIDCALSGAIPTVGVIDWTTDLADLSEASIEFTLNDPKAGELNTGSGGPIDIDGSEHRALMLGLKPERTYTYRIVAKNGATVCTSSDHTLTTGASVAGGPAVTRAVEDAGARARGFIVTSSGFPLSPGVAYILDADGEVVWWADAPANCARALMDWEGANMWMLATKPTPTSLGGLRRIAMDGSDVSDDFTELAEAHHDLAVLPGGILATLLWSGDSLDSSDLVERSPDGSVHTVVRLDDSVFKLGDNEGFHTNALLYHPADDSYTVSELYAHAYVKLTREGEPLWQLGTDCMGVPAPKCAKANLPGNHGHQLLDNGHFLFFNSVMSGNSVTYEYSITETGPSFTASQVWSYEVPGLKSTVLGDVQRLPNGNTLIDYSTVGQMHELSPSGDVVQVITAEPLGTQVSGTFGYMNFRETLYGPPLR